VSAKLWHRRLDHASFPAINKAISLAPRNKITSICSECQLAKSHVMPFKHVHVFVLKPLELIYSDVWGPTPILSTTGARYYINFLDDATKYLWLFPLKLKSDAYQTFIYFQTDVERQFNTKIKALQSDWGGEFRSLHKYLHSQGINHRITCPYPISKLVQLKDVTVKLLK
jgi:histone deacetylase 1/2